MEAVGLKFQLLWAKGAGAGAGAGATVGAGVGEALAFVQTKEGGEYTLLGWMIWWWLLRLRACSVLATVQSVSSNLSSKLALICSLLFKCIWSTVRHI
jgi:hypothetical protein